MTPVLSQCFSSTMTSCQTTCWICERRRIDRSLHESERGHYLQTVREVTCTCFSWFLSCFKLHLRNLYCFIRRHVVLDKLTSLPSNSPWCLRCNLMSGFCVHGIKTRRYCFKFVLIPTFVKQIEMQFIFERSEVFR